MFNIGDEVEFWMPDGYKYRHGCLVRKEKTTCFVLVQYAKISRVHKIKEKQLNCWRGFENANGKKEFNKNRG